MIYDNIAEVVVGVTAQDTGAEVTLGTIRLGGKPVARGIYSADNPPPGFKWGEFAKKAIRYDGFGITVLYVGDERTGVRARAEKIVAADKRQLEEQAKVRDAMVKGKYVKPKDKPKEKFKAVTPNE